MQPSPPLLLFWGPTVWKNLCHLIQLTQRASTTTFFFKTTAYVSKSDEHACSGHLPFQVHSCKIVWHQHHPRIKHTGVVRTSRGSTTALETYATFVLFALFTNIETDHEWKQKSTSARQQGHYLTSDLVPKSSVSFQQNLSASVPLCVSEMYCLFTQTPICPPLHSTGGGSTVPTPKGVTAIC